MTPLRQDTSNRAKRDRAKYYREYRKKKGGLSWNEWLTSGYQRYYENPNICSYCGKVIEIREGEKPHVVRKKKFCNAICSSSSRKKPEFLSICDYCGKHKKKKSNKFCSKSCGARARGKLKSTTKAELFSRRSGYQSARSSIQRDARYIYKMSGRPMACVLCGYFHHVDIAHIKGVSDFDDSATVGEINDIKNLAALCPNHHWEFDNGILPANTLSKKIIPDFQLTNWMLCTNVNSTGEQGRQ